MKFCKQLLLAGLGLLLALPLFAADTNSAPAVTREELSASLLQVQEQLHAAQLALEQDQQAAADQSRSNALVTTARLQALEQMMEAQRSQDAAAGRQMQQTTYLMFGGFALAGLGILVWLAYVQWRAFAQFARVSAEQQTALASIHQLAAPGRATVESSNARLLDVIGQLERRINELEGGPRLLADTASADANGKAADALAEGQKLLAADTPQLALEFFDKFLAAHPQNTRALAKKAEALEKLGRTAEALRCYEQMVRLKTGE